MWNKASIWEIAKFIIITALIVVPFRMYVAQPFIVSGSSMEQTYHNGDYLIVDELTYRFRQPQTGEVIIFKYPKNPSQDFIKRIIGKPSEKVEIRGGKVFVNGQELNEDYYKGQTLIDVSVTLDKGQYFVLGDNRPFSSDSRYWGTVPENLIIGRPIVRLWSTVGIAKAFASMKEIF